MCGQRALTFHLTELVKSFVCYIYTILHVCRYALVTLLGDCYVDSTLIADVNSFVNFNRCISIIMVSHL